MTSIAIGSLVGVGFLTIVNLVTIAYSYGKLTEKVINLCRRVEALEDRVYK